MPAMPVDLRMTRRGFLKASGGALAVSALFPLSRNLFAQAAGADSGQIEVKNGLCHHCHFSYCTMRYTVQDGVLVGLEGAPEGPYNKGKACVRGLSSINYVYNPYRIKTPLKRTNPKKGLDVDPGWVEISWEEALGTLTEKLKAVREDDPRKLVWFNGFPVEVTIMGRSRFTAAFGTPNAGSATGNLCSVHLSNGLLQGGTTQRPDYKYTNYCIALGGTLGLNHASADGGSDGTLDAIERGMKVVVVDPYCSQDAKVGEWVPIRPGTDLAYLLAMGHVMLYEIKRCDEWFLKNRTTAPYLLKADGSDYQRHSENNKPLIWDPVDNLAKAFDDPTIQGYALEGEYAVDGATVRPAFLWLKESLAGYTPEWAETICTVPAETIRRHSREFVDAAQIGSTIDINGVTFPYRPACTLIGRGLTNHYDGHIAFWMASVVNMLVGAVAVPGGNLNPAERPTMLKPDEDGVVIREARMSARARFKLPPSRIDVPEFLPFAFAGANRTFDVILEPEKYGMDYVPEILATVGANYMTKGAVRYERFVEAYNKVPFSFSCSYHMDEQSMLSDLVLPDITYLEQSSIFSYTTVRPGHTQKVGGGRGHKAIIQPLFNLPPLDDVLIDLAERVGILYGERRSLNTILNATLKDGLKLDVNKKYKIEEYLDRYIQSAYGKTLDEFSKTGFHVIEVPEEKAYSYYYFPNNKTRHPFYNIEFRQAGDQLLEGLKNAGMKHPGIKEEEIRFYYQGVPAYKPTPAQTAPEDFDLYGVMRRIPHIMFDIAAAGSNPWLQETAAQHPHYNKLLLNTATAKKKGLADGDMVYIESHFGPGRKLGPYPVKTTELIHPDGVGVFCGAGRMPTGMNPITAEGINYNMLISNAWDAVDVITGGCDLSPRVKLTKA